MIAGDDSAPKSLQLDWGPWAFYEQRRNAIEIQRVYCPVVHWNTWTGISEETNAGNSQENDRYLR